jgi:hypothetical protein
MRLSFRNSDGKTKEIFSQKKKSMHTQTHTNTHSLSLSLFSKTHQIVLHTCSNYLKIELIERASPCLSQRERALKRAEATAREKHRAKLSARSKRFNDFEKQHEARATTSHSGVHLVEVP